MDEGIRRSRAANRQRTQRTVGTLAERPDRIALWAFLIAIVVMIAAAASAHAGSGGTGVGGGGTTSAGSKYSRLWTSFKTGDHRWAHRTSQCESGGDPTAIGGGGAYRGAFQFTRSTWHNAPKSPGGDPIRYSWKTQAVVAVLLKHHVGTSPWPNCG